LEAIHARDAAVRLDTGETGSSQRLLAPFFSCLFSPSGMHGANPAKKVVDAIKQAADLLMSETKLRELLRKLGAEAARKRK